MLNDCISCGMPMETPAQHAMGDVSKQYCIYCAHPDGSMQSYEERVEGMTGYMMRTEKLEPDAARIEAKKYMATLPAWMNDKTS